MSDTPRTDAHPYPTELARDLERELNKLRVDYSRVRAALVDAASALRLGNMIRAREAYNVLNDTTNQC